MRPHRHARLALVVPVALVLASGQPGMAETKASEASPAATPCPSITIAPAPSFLPGSLPTTLPSPAPDAGPSATPRSVTHSMDEILALFPAKVGTVDLSAPQWVRLSDQLSPDRCLRAGLEAELFAPLGVGLDDVSEAIAGGPALRILALHADGVPGTDLRGSLIRLAAVGDDPIPATREMLGDKVVVRTPRGFWYAVDDIVWLIEVEDRDLLMLVLEALP